MYSRPSYDTKPIDSRLRVFAGRPSQIIGIVILGCTVAAIVWFQRVQRERIAAEEIEQLGGKVHYVESLASKVIVDDDSDQQMP